MLRSGRVVSKRGVIQEMDEELGAAVVDIVDEAAVTTGHVGMGLSMKKSVENWTRPWGLRGCVLDVDDGGVGGGVGVYGEVTTRPTIFS